MVLFGSAIWSDLVSLLRFPFLCHVQVFSCEIMPYCHLKYPYNCFSSHFCFLVIIVLLNHVLFVFTVISLSLFFFMKSSRCLIDVSTQYLMLAGSLPPFFLDIYMACLCHLWYVRPYASSWVFLSSGLLVEVLLLSTLRMVPSILQEW